MLKEALNLKNLSPPDELVLETLVTSADGPHSKLAENLKTIRKVPIGSKNSRLIFSSSSQLGLYESNAFQKFFISLSEESQNIKFARLNRQFFKEFL